MLYVPSFLLLVLAVWVFLSDELAKFVPPIKMIPLPSESFVGAFYKISFLHFLVALVASAVLLVRTFVSAKRAVVRQQVKWVVWGALLAIAPFTFLYGITYLVGAETDRWLTDAAILPLILIPLCVRLFSSSLPVDGR